MDATKRITQAKRGVFWRSLNMAEVMIIADCGGETRVAGAPKFIFRFVFALMYSGAVLATPTTGVIGDAD